MVNFEIFSFVSSRRVAELDTKRNPLTTTPKEYVEINTPSYYILLNTWGNLFRQYAPFTLEVFKGQVVNHGAIATIQLLVSESEKFIKEKGDFLPFTLQLINEIQTDGNWQRILLLLLRFGKRFSPSKVDLIEESSIKDFIQVENRTKLIQRNPVPLWLKKALHEELASVLLPTKVNKRDRYFSNGAVADGGPVLSDKLDAIGNNCERPWGLEYPMAMHSLDLPEYSGNQRICTAKILVVPKSYKAGRIIAEEEAYRQYENSAVYKMILKLMRSSGRYSEFCIENQDMNRNLCCLASIEKGYATIDLSHASDCVSKSFVRTIFPAWLLPHLSLLPNRITIGKKSYQLQMAATAGSILTFVIETLTFWSIARVAKTLYEVLTGETIASVSVYGDDIIVPTEIAELTIELLERLGFMVNEEKSFISPTSNYRETCGMEYFNGFDVSSRYYPRQVLTFNLKDGKIVKGPETYSSMTSLIPLQHALFEHPFASGFLVSVIRSFFPEMTSSAPGTDSSDLWEIFPICRNGFPPHTKGVTLPPEYGRELHYCNVASYPKSTKDSLSRENYDTYRYQHFLQFGPRYEDPLMELLGCSSPDSTFDEVSNKPQTKWRLI